MLKLCRQSAAFAQKKVADGTTTRDLSPSILTEASSQIFIIYSLSYYCNHLFWFLLIVNFIVNSSAPAAVLSSFVYLCSLIKACLAIYCLFCPTVGLILELQLSIILVIFSSIEYFIDYSIK